MLSSSGAGQSAQASDRSLIIGSSGLLGKALMRHLKSVGQDFAVCNRRHLANLEIMQFQLEELPNIDQSFDVIYLLAAQIPYANMNSYSPALIDANIGLVLDITQQFPESHIVFSSSVSVYGTPTQQPITESHPYNQPNAYGMSKICAESILRAHPSYCILRFSSLYGVEMQTPTFLPLIINQAIKSNEIRLQGDGTRLQNYLCVEDAATMLTVAANSRLKAVVHATANESHSNRQIAEIIASQVGNTKIRYSGTDDSPSFEYSTHRWNQLFGHRTRVPIEEGIKGLIENAKNK